MKYLVFIGSGGFARELLWLAREVNASREAVGHNDPVYRILGFISEEPGEPGGLGGLSVLGNDEWAIQHLERNVHFVVAIGDPIRRRAIATRYLAEGFPAATLVHPSVLMAEDVRLGQGCVLCAGAVLTTNIQLGDFVSVNLNATVGHDSVLGAYTTVHPGANLSGDVQVGEGCDLGSGSVILPGKRLGDQVVLGAGAVVTKDLQGGRTYIGVPARPAGPARPTD